MWSLWRPRWSAVSWEPLSSMDLRDPPSLPNPAGLPISVGRAWSWDILPLSWAVSWQNMPRNKRERVGPQHCPSQPEPPVPNTAVDWGWGSTFLAHHPRGAFRSQQQAIPIPLCLLVLMQETWSLPVCPPILFLIRKGRLSLETQSRSSIRISVLKYKVTAWIGEKFHCHFLPCRRLLIWRNYK